MACINWAGALRRIFGIGTEKNIMKKLGQLVVIACVLSMTFNLPRPASAAVLGGRQTYTFEQGDSLPDIAGQFGVTLKTLRRANGLVNNRVIPGTVLTIPTADAPNIVSPHIARAINPQPGDGKVIYISLGEQRMRAYEGDKLMFDYLVSTGLPTTQNPDRDTRPGVFRVKTKLPEAYASLWDLRMPYWMGIYDSGNIENGIHAMPLLGNGRQVSWRVGTRGSYGCIVLTTKDGKALYDWAELGTLVVIRS